MTDEVYSPKKLALSLGFTEEQADRFERLGCDATKIRKVAKAKNMPMTKPKLGKPDAINPQPKHRHSYRKDGSCSCGAVRKVKAKAAS